MKNFISLLNNHWSNKILLRIMAIVALVGVADTAYLTASHYFGTGIQCLLLKDCETVLKSQYAFILGIPLAILGLIFYAGMFVLVNLYDIYQDKYTLGLLAAGGAIGFAASLSFLYLQLLVLKALCFYCLISLASSTLLLIMGIIIYKRGAYELSL